MEPRAVSTMRSMHQILSTLESGNEVPIIRGASMVEVTKNRTQKCALSASVEV